MDRNHPCFGNQSQALIYSKAHKQAHNSNRTSRKQRCTTKRMSTPLRPTVDDYSTTDPNEAPHSALIPNIPKYDSNTDLDDHNNTYEWAMTSLRMYRRLTYMYFLLNYQEMLTNGSRHYDLIASRVLNNYNISLSTISCI